MEGMGVGGESWKDKSESRFNPPTNSRGFSDENRVTMGPMTTTAKEIDEQNMNTVDCEWALRAGPELHQSRRR
eukprot:scaffold76035_cov28-Tisochrysis_lutea.AAC.5